MIIANKLQSKVEASNQKLKDQQEALRLLGEEVQELQPQHDASKKTLLEKKKVHRNSQASTCIVLLSFQGLLENLIFYNNTYFCFMCRV